MTTSKRANGHRDLDAFPLDTALSKPQRIAAFLDWWAERHPYDFVGYHEITKAIEGFRRLPRLENKEVDATREIVGRTGKILQDKYKRTLIRYRGIGARASVDSIDAIRHSAVSRAKKVERDIVSLAKLDEIIDVKSIPDTPENKPLKQWYQRDVRGILKQVSAPDFLSKMLPPAPPEDK